MRIVLSIKLNCFVFKVPAVVEDTDVAEESGWKVGVFVDALCSQTGAWFLGIRRGV